MEMVSDADSAVDGVGQAWAGDDAIEEVILGDVVFEEVIHDPGWSLYTLSRIPDNIAVEQTTRSDTERDSLARDQLDT